MKFMLLIYGNDEIWGSFTEEEGAAMEAADAAFRREIRESGELVSMEGLLSVDDVRVVRVRDGASVVTEGPYLDTKEHLGNFFVIDCEGLERAVELASRYPVPGGGGVEVWPLMN